MTEQQHPPNPVSPDPSYRAPHLGGETPAPHGQPSGYTNPYAPQHPQTREESPQAPHPYGQLPQPYGQVYGQQALPPYGPMPQMRPKRPGTVTAASVLGIVGGGMGIYAGFFAILSISSIQDFTRYSGAPSGLPVLLVLSYANALGVFATAVALLVSGITFLRGKGRTVLLIAAVAQAVMTLFFLVILLMIPQLLGLQDLPDRVSRAVPSSINGITLLAVAIGLGLAGSIIYLLLSPTARTWQKISETLR